MQSGTQTAPVSKNMLWAGRIISALPVLLMVFGGTFGLVKPAVAMPGFLHYGYPERLLLPICIVEIVCAVLYAIPRTSVLGAILLTGYFGGATATHVRVGDPVFFVPVFLGVLVWGGLYLRDGRLRGLIPLRSQTD
jgi:membrane protease YdiL (CAAX protease family)